MIQTLRATKWNSARFGLVLAGGGAKGAYQAGVIQALYELDIADKVYAVSGTSVGALNTLAFALNRKELCPEVWRISGLRMCWCALIRRSAPSCASFGASFPPRAFACGILTRF